MNIFTDWGINVMGIKFCVCLLAGRDLCSGSVCGGWLENSVGKPSSIWIFKVEASVFSKISPQQWKTIQE